MRSIHFVACLKYQVNIHCKGRLYYRLFNMKLTVEIFFFFELYLSLSSLSNRSPTKDGSHVLKVSFFLKSIKCLLMNTVLSTST